MGKIKVLIVEDDRLIAENSTIMLHTLGYDVCEICSNSEDAIREIESNRPDIVLIDILLSGDQDGISFADNLRNIHDLPFVYVTATSDEVILERAKLTSPYGYIIKPFNGRDLHSNIEMALYKFNTETKIEHLNQMLYALNDINQISNDGMDEAEYLKLLCNTLIKFPSFQYVWTGLLDKSSKIWFELHTAQSELDQDVRPFYEDGELAECARSVLETNEVSVLIAPCEKCQKCSLADYYANKPVINARIAFENNVYGILTAVVLPSMSSNREFLRLFSELAHKIGSRFHALASKKKFGRAKLDLARSEERFNRLTEIAQDIIIVHDTEGIISYANPSTLDLLEIEMDQILGKNLDKLVAPKSLAELDERQKEHSRESKNIKLRYEIMFQTQSKVDIPVEVSLNPIFEKGEISNFLLIGRDMRERKEQEAQLRTFSRVIEQSPAAILITDSDGLITYVNPKFTTMTGFSRAEVIGEFPAILKTKSITDEIATDLIKTTLNDEVWRGELETIRSNGEEFWIYATISAMSDDDGNYSYIGIIEDISDKKQTALELEGSKQSYQDIFNSTSDAIYIQDKEGKFIAVNNGAVAMYGYAREYLIGKTPADLSADGYNNLDDVLALFNKAFDGEPQRFEFWGKRKNGEVFPKDVQINRVHYFGKDVMLATARDISDRKNFEAELQEAVKKAEKSEEVKGYFLANMSHEIRTPLTSIVGYIDLIFNRIKDHLSEQDQAYFDIIRRNSDRLTSTVHSIIDLSQIEAGDTSLDRVSVNLTDLVSNVYNDHKVAADNKNIKFAFEKPTENFLFSGDKSLLHAAVSNLVDNAISYTDEGRVDLFLKEGSENTCLLEIKDTGIGIAKKSLQSIFESFSQESMGYTKDYQGLGLGLTLAKKNFEMHDLKIEVDSEKGRGSCFTIRFPRLVDDQPSDEIIEAQLSDETITQTQVQESDHVLKSAAASSERQHHVLIVEDDESAQRLFGLFLKNHYEVHFATTVQDGREVLLNHAIDLVVTDLSLIGGEDGLALVEWVRHEPRFKNLPVIALTAHAFVSDRERCLDAGCNDFITKPIFRSQLLQIIKKNIQLEG